MIFILWHEPKGHDWFIYVCRETTDMIFSKLIIINLNNLELHHAFYKETIPHQVIVNNTNIIKTTDLTFV